MFDARTLRSVSVDFLNGTRAGEDARAPGPVRDAADAFEAALADWNDAGARLPACETVLQAGNALLDALHEANHEGLPFGVRDRATEMLTLVDEAAGNGFAVEAAASPQP